MQSITSRRQAGGARLLDMVMPFEAGAGRARDGKDDELVDGARQRALEF
jgi:hypothetical protein